MPKRLLGALYRHYLLVVPPVLVAEIRADLTKKHDGGPEKLRILSEKLRGSNDAMINMDHRDLRIASLLGKPITMDGRPIVEVETFITSRGPASLVVETPENDQLFRWRGRQFTESDTEAATEWRKVLASVNLEKTRESLKSSNPDLPPVQSLSQLGQLIEVVLATGDQRLLLQMCVEDAQLDEKTKQEIICRWDRIKPTSLFDFAPYAFFCFRIRMLFHFGLMNNLMTTKASNTADLLYLYYVPFCKVFCSNDKIHLALQNFVLRTDQRFIRFGEFRNDLDAISFFWDSLTQNERHLWFGVFGHWPPRNSGSFTFQRWKATMATPARKHKAVRCPTPPPGHIRDLIDTFREALNQKRPQTP